MPVDNTIYARRALELVERAMSAFRVVIVNGPRQSGKSTLLEFLEVGGGGSRISLDDRDSLRTARTDPGGLVSESQHPMLIDEVQRGGEPLILAIKADVDRHAFDHGRYVLAGSSRFLTIPNLSESLAGRARLVELWPLAQSEIEGVRSNFVDALFDPSALRAVAAEPSTRVEVFGRLAIGGFPAAVRMGDPRDRDDWFADYLNTLLQRDLAQLRTPRRVVDLQRMLRLLAQRTAGEFVIDPLSSDLGVTADTTKDYVALFESIFLHLTIPAWTPGGSGRAVRRRKLHIVDSGVAAYLQGMTASRLAQPGCSEAGPLLESFVANEVLRLTAWGQLRPALHHYRDRDRREIDLVLETRDGLVAAIEVKAARDVDDGDFRHLRWLRDRLGDRFAQGVVLHLGDRTLPAGDRLSSVPVSALWTGK